MKFIADGMVGRLARWLRLIGHDVEYSRNWTDEQLIRRALNESRTLLTSDVELYRRAVADGAEAFLVKDRTEAERLARIAKRYKIDLNVETANSRCPKCNAAIRPVEKEQIKNKVSLSTYEMFNEFWECTNNKCGKVYWRGSHWKKIYEHLSDAADRIIRL